MKNQSTSIGCGLLIIVVSIVGFFRWLVENPAGWFIVIAIGFLTFLFLKTVKQNRVSAVSEAFLNIANQLERLAKSKDEPTGITLMLHKGEKPLFVLYGTSLTEYRSGGSSYSGTSVGVSVPITGNIRGYLGGNSGSITPNPDQLVVVDVGTSVFTNQRIVFTGEQYSREWEFSKLLSLELGENGQTVKIATSNRDKTSGLQTPYSAFGVGYPAGYAQTWFEEGEAAARKWLLDRASDLRSAVADVQNKSGKELK